MYTSFPRGLNANTVLERQRREGMNVLYSNEERTLLIISKDILKEPMFLLLLGAGIIYFVLGDIAEALALVGFVIIIMLITVLQERRTENALNALKHLASPRALVIRDGQLTRIAGQDVVREDVVLVSEGDRIPADGVVQDGQDLAIDESMLTGEAEAVNKFNHDSIYAGTLVVRGRALIEITQIGNKTALGKISHSLTSLSLESSPIQQEITLLTKRLALIAGGLSILLSSLYWWLKGGWLEGLLAGITLAMAILPQEFPVIMTVFFALGARRIASERVLTRRLSAIETLGETTVLCVDKTGTLTENRMVLAGLAVENTLLEINSLDNQSLPEEFHELLEYAVLASDMTPHDPMEMTFLQFFKQHLSDTEHNHPDWSLIQAYALSPELLAMSHLWQSSDQTRRVVAAKGAPEAIIDLCHLDNMQSKRIAQTVADMAQRGWRVLAVAKALYGKTDRLPQHQHEFDFQWVGLVGFNDPLRIGVADAVTICHHAGIRVIMMTGDHPHTAKALAHQAGIHHTQTITGEELAGLSKQDLLALMKTVNVFARVTPQQKLMVVEMLKSQGEIVAMTGDGVNDAPALKASHIGIAMGKRGTDVAREAGSLVLMDDDFLSIVSAIRLGRQIFANLRQALIYILAVHIPVIGLTLLPVLFGYPQILMPMHIAFLELIIGPVYSIVFEAHTNQKDIMMRAPRLQTEHLLNVQYLWGSIVQGLCITVVVLMVYQWQIYIGTEVNQSRAMAFEVLVLANLALLLVFQLASSSLTNIAKVTWVVVILTLFSLQLIVNVSYLAQLFSFAPLSSANYLILIFIGLMMLILFFLYQTLEQWILNSKKVS